MCFKGVDGEVYVTSRESREGRQNPEIERVLSLQTLCVLNCADIWLLPPCWNSWSVLFLCRLLFSSILPLVQSAVCCLLSRRKPALCLFVPGMSCLFWAPHPVKSTGCLLTVLATQPPTFMLWLSLCGFRDFTCKHIIAVGCMIKIILPQTDCHHCMQSTFFHIKIVAQ